MKNIIFYFSSTGNTYYAAKYLKDNLENCEIYNMAAPLSNDIVGNEETNIGFIFPTYFFSIPRPVENFIKLLKLSSKAHYYGIVTCNGFPGNTVGQLKNILKDKNCTLSYFTSLFMPGNYIIEYSGLDKDRTDKRLKKIKEQLPDICNSITHRHKNNVNKKFEFISNLFFNSMYKQADVWHAGFCVTDECIGCGICAKVCPFDNITIKDKKPVWGNKCEHCVACIQWCPNKAVEYGKRTLKRRRYTNPDVSLKEFLTQVK